MENSRPAVIRDGVNVGPQEMGWLNYEKLEEIKKARWVADVCLRAKGGGWVEQPFAVFYQPEPQPEHGHYFAIYRDQHGALITNAQSAADGIYKGSRASPSEVIFSRWNHDFRSAQTGNVTVDGGRNYGRILFEGTPPESVLLRVVGHRFVEVPSEEAIVALMGDRWVVGPNGDREKVERWCENHLDPGGWRWITDGVVRIEKEDDAVLALYRLNFA